MIDLPSANRTVMSASSSERYFGGEEYFDPRLQLDASEKKSQVESLLGGFRLSRAQVDKLRSLLKKELELGLQAKPERPSVFPMINTFVTQFPNGAEVGDFLGMDIGGTNLRIVHLKLTKVGDKFEKKIVLEFYDVPVEVRQGEGKAFFGFFAKCAKEFLVKYNLLSIEKALPLGFTFSFGYDQFAIDQGEIVQMGIQTYVHDIIRKCPVKLLQEAIDSLALPVRVVALANDTTATLVYAIYLDKETTASLILGSGTNIAYIENVERFGKISDPVATFGCSIKEFVVNSEFPLYGDEGDMDFAKTEYDLELDRISLVPKTYTYEKITGGAYLGEALRLIIISLAKKGVLLGGQVTEQLTRAGVLGTPSISFIESELEQNGNNARTNSQAKTLLVQLGYNLEQISKDDCAIVTWAGQLLTIRSATFIAAAVSIFTDHIDRQVVKVGTDGSLFKKHPKMSKMINKLVNTFSPNKKTIVFSADQGSGIGVAMLAATEASAKP